CLAQKLVDYRVVIREGFSAHKHKVFLVVFRRRCELVLCLVQGKPAKIPPRALLIQSTAIRIKVTFRWKSGGHCKLSRLTIGITRAARGSLTSFRMLPPPRVHALVRRSPARLPRGRRQ